MHILTHYRLCPASRSIRLILSELGIGADLHEEEPWTRRTELLQLNPAGELPVLQLDGGPILCGAYAISEYIGEEITRHPADGRAVPLFPGNREERAEVRRLVDWFHGKFNREVSQPTLEEKVYARSAETARRPDVGVMRAVRANIRYHLSYINYLADQRAWLAGEQLSFADFAAAAHLSSMDYLGEVAWDEYAATKAWYARMKSRPTFRALLADRVSSLEPPAHYVDLDF